MHKYTIFPLKNVLTWSKITSFGQKITDEAGKIHFTELKSEKISKLLKNQKWNPNSSFHSVSFLNADSKNLTFLPR